MRLFALFLLCALSANALAAGRLKLISASALVSGITGGRRYRAESMQSIQRHFRDSNKNYISLEDMAKITQAPPARYITGSNYIMSPLFPWHYKYETLREGNTLVIHIKVHFKNITADQRAKLEEDIKQAENIWNENIPVGLVGFPFRFQFDIMKNPKDAFYSVGYLAKTRGPFYENWSQEWAGRGIAHEIGHMMGLSDEYDEITASGGCNAMSIMCDGWNGIPVSFHYYHILRRALLPVKP